MQGVDTEVAFSVVPGMEVVPWTQRRITKPRKVHCVHAARTEKVFGVHNSSLANLGRALHERVFRVQGEDGLVEPPKPVEGLIESKCSWYRRSLRNECQFLPRHSRQQVVECYVGQKRLVYQKAADSLLTRPLTSADAKIKAFVKAEKINFSDKPDPAPRLIQPRAPRYNVELGRYLRINEKRILKLIDRIAGEPTVMKGYNVEQLGSILSQKWNKYSDPIAVGLDASRWDQHCSVEALRFEHSIYESLFPGDKYLKWLLSLQIVNQGIGLAKDGGIRYTVHGCRMSGDVNTSLGNCLLMCGLVMSYARERGITLSLANNGDDCVVVMERNDLKAFSKGLGEWFLDMGYKLTIEDPVDVLEQLEFCQSQPVCVSGKWRMVRTPRNSVGKDAYTIVSMQGPGDARAWCAAVGDCGLTLTAGLPVLQNLYDKYRHWGKGARPSKAFRSIVLEYGNVERVRGLEAKLKPESVSPSTRISFYKAFGVSPDLQVATEKQIDNLSDITLVSSPVETSFRHLPSTFFTEQFHGFSTCLPRLQPLQ